MIPLVPAALWRKRDGRLALLCVGILTVFITGGLTFSQGDRITSIGLPLWLIAFVLTVEELGGGEALKSLAGRRRVPPTPVVARPAGES
jgi:hypothetical protein